MPKKYRSEGLDAKPNQIRMFLKDPKLLDLWDQMTVGKPGDFAKTAQRNDEGQIEPYRDAVTVLKEPERGNSRQYALRKLRDDAPEIHARVLAGELSPNAGMVSAR